jgi:hypothetical protein
VRVSLYKGGVFQYVIVPDMTAGAGTCRWTVPVTQAAGENYKIRVTCNANINVYDYSDTDFTIGSPITVTSPNGGENWGAGTSHDITWDYEGGCSSEVRVSLYKGGVFQYVIAPDMTAGAGMYSWTVPVSQTAGDDYKIRVTCNANINVYDLSDSHFSISMT